MKPAGLSLDVVAYAAPQELHAVNAAERRGHYLASAEASKGPVRCQESAAEQISVAKELLPKRPDTVRVTRMPDSLALDLKALAGSWYGVLEPSGEIASFAIADVVGVGRRAMFSSVSGWRRGGLYEFSTV
jgi:hypothetical protein